MNLPQMVYIVIKSVSQVMKTQGETQPAHTDTELGSETRVPESKPTLTTMTERFLPSVTDRRGLNSVVARLHLRGLWVEVREPVNSGGKLHPRFHCHRTDTQHFLPG